MLEDPPATSHLAFGLMTSLDTFKLEQWGSAESAFTSYWWPNTYTYVKLRADASAEAVAAELPAFIARHREPGEAARFVPALQPLTDIHLRSDLGSEWQAGGDAATVGVFTLIALFVLLLACVNFMNLATARATERAKEVGVRKTVGAQRGQLVAQFFSESLLLSLGALALGLAAAQLLLPFFSELAGRELTFRFGDLALWGWVLGATLVTGLLAGSYPALYLSRFRPAHVLAGGRSGGRGAARLRQGLVLFQFTLSIALIAATAIAWQQLQFLQTADLGFEEDHVVVIQRKGADLDVLAARLAQEPNVLGVTTSQRAPGFGFGGTPQVEFPPYSPIEQLDGGGGRTTHQQVGPGYFDLFEIDLLAGRPFSDDPADIGTAAERPESFGNSAFDGRALVVNASFVEAQGWTPEEALGRELRMYYYENGQTFMDHRGTVVGVVRDFHAAPFQYAIEPAIFSPARFPGDLGTTAQYAFVKVQPGDAAETMAALGAAYADVHPERAFEAAFLDDDLDARYRVRAAHGDDPRGVRLLRRRDRVPRAVRPRGVRGRAAHQRDRRAEGARRGRARPRRAPLARLPAPRRDRGGRGGAAGVVGDGPLARRLRVPHRDRADAVPRRRRGRARPRPPHRQRAGAPRGAEEPDGGAPLRIGRPVTHVGGLATRSAPFRAEDP